MPTFLRRLRARIKYWNHERDLAREIEAHRSMAEADLASTTPSPQHARWAAARLLGNTTIAREDSRAMWIPIYLQQISQDARYALRGIRRDAAFTFATVLMLAIGIGLTSGGLGFINGLFLRGWPVPANRDVFRVETLFAPSPGRVDDGLSFAAYQHIAANAVGADYVASGGAYMRISNTKGARYPGSIPIGMYVSENFFAALRIPLAMGTPPLAESASSGPTAVISHRIWQTVFAGDPNILGRTIWLDGEPAIAVGVTARDFTGLDREAGVYLPLWSVRPLHERDGVADAVKNPNTCCVYLAGRTRPGVSRPSVAAELTGLVAQYRTSIGAPPLSLALADTTSGDAMMRRGDLAVMLGMIGAGALALLVLTCANVGNLHLARSLRRRHEIVTRLALGASRSRVVRQLLTEGLVLASIAGVLAFGATVAVPKLIALSGEPIPATVFGVDWRVAIGTALTVVIVCLMVSLAPALQVTRIVWRGSSALTTGRTGGLRGALLSVQIAIATVLILGAALLARGMQHAITGPSDFALKTTTAVTIEWPRDAAPNNTQMQIFRADLEAAIATSAFPIGLTTNIPASSRSSINTSVREPDANVDFSTQLAPLNAAAAAVLKLRLKSGRWASDNEAAREGVVNETLARAVWGDAEALGRTLRLDFDNTVYTVVGVVTDSHILAPDAVDATLHIAPLTSTPVLLTTTSGDSDAAVRSLLTTIAPSAHVTFLPLTESNRGSVVRSAGAAIIAGGLGLLALVLAMIGVYGVFSYLVEERRREIGIRVALGASRTQIRRAVFRATRLAITSGLVAGFAMSVGGALALRAFLFGLSPADPISYAVAGAILVGTAIVATLVPIRRALRVNPAVTLRAD